MRLALLMLGAMAGAAIYAVYRARPWTLQRVPRPSADDVFGGRRSTAWGEVSH